MATLDEALAMIHSYAHPEQLEGMARFGLVGEGRLGLSVPEMRGIAKQLKRDHDLALKLWDTGIPEAMMVASMIADPRLLTAAQMDAWAQDFMAWDVCDQVCGNLFDKSALAWTKPAEWASREEEFVKRAAFALMACLAWHDKTAADDQFVPFLPLIVQGSSDPRNFVKKAVSWALRNIGKRNLALNAAALQTVHEIQLLESRASRWIAADALKELTGQAVQRRLHG